MWSNFLLQQKNKMYIDILLQSLILSHIVSLYTPNTFARIAVLFSIALTRGRLVAYIRV